MITKPITISGIDLEKFLELKALLRLEKPKRYILNVLTDEINKTLDKELTKIKKVKEII